MHHKTGEKPDSDLKKNTNSGTHNSPLKKNPNGDDPDETPEPGESRKEGSGYHSQSEVDQPQRGADTSFSEKNDVTPPNKREFPSVGPAKTDFEARPQGRTTGRMVGHEPGTEGI